MTARTTVHRLQVATELHRFIEPRCCPAPASTAPTFWSGFDAIVADLAPKNIALLAERDRLQTELDAWHKANPGPIRDMPATASSSKDRLPGAGARQGARPPPPTSTPSWPLQAGPQLVVPIPTPATR
jgi:malate synthase